MLASPRSGNSASPLYRLRNHTLHKICHYRDRSPVMDQTRLTLTVAI
jgi:hypothetical protein